MSKPILFNTEMVKAILGGRKTQTRRVVKPQPALHGSFWERRGAGWSDGIKSFHPVPCHSMYETMPYKPGDILWVRETWADVFGKIEYRSDFDDESNAYRVTRYGKAIARWRPSIFMPKTAARLFLNVTDVRCERLQEICCENALKEGMPPPVIARDEFEPIAMFHELWDSINNKRGYPWLSNPWVWVITFERCDKPDGDT